MKQREIKFRAYSHRSKRMWGWSTLTDEEIGEMLREPNQEEIMQFTGLLDKQGVEIYEGDIVKVRNPEQNHYRVMLIERSFQSGAWPILRIDQGFTKIIGNIYENPDLIK